MRVRLSVPSDLNRDETEAAINAALESVTRSAEPLVRRGAVPSFVKALKAGRVRWRPEPPGDEHFDLPQTVLRRGWGDCDDLAPWHAASLRASGVDPEATAIVRPSGPGRWHALVQRSDGSIEDPSRAAGMGSVGADNYVGPLQPALWDGMQLSTLPWGGGWAGRVDVPSLSVPAAYSAMTHARTPLQAIRAGCRGGVCVGDDDIDPADALALVGLHDLLSGVSPAELNEALEHEGAVGFIPALMPAAMSLAAPMLSKLLPGGKAAPGAAPGAAMPGGGMAPGTVLSAPGGPIIVRF